MSEDVREQTALDVRSLREAIREEYAEVASDPHNGFHFHTERPLARIQERRVYDPHHYRP